MAWGRRVRVTTCANTNANVRANGSARYRRRERHGTAINSYKERLGQESEHASTKAAAPANELSQPGTKAGISSGGAAARSDFAFHLGSKAGASTWLGKRSSSPC
jgi:hypothetical protein